MQIYLIYPAVHIAQPKYAVMFNIARLYENCMFMKPAYFLLNYVVLLFIYTSCYQANQNRISCCGVKKNYCDSLTYNTCPVESDHLPRIKLDTLFARVYKESYSFIVKSEIIKSPSFKYLYDHPKAYQKDILTCIIDTSKLLTYRTWAIESQTACDDNYYEFATQVVELYKQGKIEERLMVNVLDPAANWNLPFVRNFQNKRFRDLMEHLKSFDNTSEDIKGFIRDIESGYVCANIELYR